MREFSVSVQIEKELKVCTILTNKHTHMHAFHVKIILVDGWTDG